MPKERFGYTKNTDTKRNTNNRKLKQSQQCKKDGKFHKCPYCGSGKGTTLCWAESKNDIDCYYYYYQQNYSWKEFLNCNRRWAPMFLQSEYLALSDGAKPYIQTFRWGRVESDLWSSSPLWTITSDHFYAPISQEFYGSPAHFCTSYSSPPSLLSKGSCLFRFTSSTGNPLWMTHCKHFLPNNANRPAG